MVPISVTLEGFLSYRERQEFDFSDRRLWMLSGDNGAGKSAVFDAITFALYGRHRLGGQNADELINRGTNLATVYFTFQVEGNRYRAQRTVGRSKAVTRLLEKDVAGQWEPLPGSENDKPFDQHVQRIVGLEYRGFTASVFLGQGDSDRLIEASPTERFNHLKQIVDLSEYESLEKRAGKRRDFCVLKVRSLNDDLRLLPPVSPDELTVAKKRRDTAQDELNSAKDAQENAILTSAGAKRYEQLTGERRGNVAKIAVAEPLVRREAAIRADAARKTVLDRVCPLLRSIHAAAEQLRQADAKVEAAIRALDARVRRLGESLGVPTGEEADVRAALDRRITDLSTRRDALPHLEAFAERRDEAAKALAQWWSAGANAAANPTPAPWETFAQAEIEDEAAMRRLWHWEKEGASEAAGRLTAAKDQAERFREIGPDTTCRYCGQLMSEERRTRQEAELQEAVGAARTEFARLTEKAKAAETDWKRAEKVLDAARQKWEHLRKVAGLADQAEANARGTWQTDWDRLPAARNRIPGAFRDAIALPVGSEQAEAGASWCAPDAYPTLNLLTMMQAEVNALPALDAERRDWDAGQQAWKGAADIQEDRQRAWESARDSLSESDRADFATATVDRTVFDRLTAERGTLKEAEQRREELEAALQDLTKLKERRDALTDEIAKMAEGHRVPIAEAETRLNAARAAVKATETELRTAEAKLDKLQEHKKERARLEDDLRRYSALRDRYELLAELLGREKLQRELLRVAEGRILEHANGILNRFSGGHLRLAPRPDDGSRGAGTALDFICHNYETGSESLLLKLLSGSQKFRVSVALALGIGQFLSGDEARRRSVIIDEGFGSLDPNGLRDMAEEIKNLGELLDRVIVVSHQNDFAEKFPDRYHIRLVNGSSRPERQIA